MRSNRPAERVPDQDEVLVGRVDGAAEADDVRGEGVDGEIGRFVAGSVTVAFQIERA